MIAPVGWCVYGARDRYQPWQFAGPVIAVDAAYGRTLFGLTLEEALAGITRNAAKELSLPDRGTLEVGKRADMVFFDIEEPAELAYWVGGVVPTNIIKAARG